jgi:AmmeMemoRadiSam system protein B
MDFGKPSLRYVEAYPIEQEGQQLVLIRDPEELLADPVVVPMPMFLVMSLLDGSRELRDVQADIQRSFQQLIPIEHLERIVVELDEFHLLANERALIRREELERDFARLDSRPAAHAGMAYPDDPAELIAAFDAYFSAPEGPPAGRPARSLAPRGLVTPHIDIRKGGPCMAWAFDELRRSPELPELYVILGVAHHPTKNLYTLTDKHFESPVGLARVNREAARRLRALYGEKRLDGEYAHKHEHSVEFQTVFLNYLHRGQREFTILPILCGSLQEDTTEGGGSPIERAEVREFCEALRKTIDDSGLRACVIAGVDLSHVGRKFGDAKGIDELRAELVKAADLRMLDQVKARDAESFFDHFRPDRNARNVDAVTAVYTMLHVLGSGDAELLSYEQYREHETDSMVTYASMVLH